MLAARTSAARNASRLLQRNFASVVDTAGVKVAAVDNGEPTSAVTFLVKAGSRYENKPGVAHALQNFAFKSTAKRSAIGTVREAELYGGVLSSSLSREHLALTAAFLRGDESFFVDVLSSFVTEAKFTRHELNEYVAPVCEAESTSAASNPATRALELAHGLAFRNGLGSPVLSTAHNPVTAELVEQYASSVFSKNNIAVLGTGISQEALSKLVEKSLGKLAASAAVSSTPSSYFGGETRVENYEGPQTVFIGFGATGAPTAELAVLAAHLNPQPSVKWSKGLSPISADVPVTASVQTVLLPYSDATLFGFLVQGETAADVKTAAAAAVSALKAAGSIKAEELKKAVAKAKFAAASSIEGRVGFATTLGAKVLAGAPSNLDGTLSSLDKVDTSAFSNASAALLKAKPTYVALGDVQQLPHADEVGL
ncbi:ubiquinol-cytochrome c reductase core subunit 1 [Steccherinum ochraceum]|uniref:Cytochrome b-c1 complex subunit 2, mitochondrial n=1 Tax=Steccherinum ochraceum TaxID=92696 RepID=A0A4R0REL1_9APHY|nr:ubiquinol-cytochrome c reductase core subunit 1 [Steccherinum ochraceum]